MYTYKEVYEATLSYFNGSEFLTNIWISKYTLKDKKGNYYELTPDDRLKLITSELVRVEKKYTPELDEADFSLRVYNLLKDFSYFIPGGSILYGVGNKQFLSSLGNCFVIGNDTDSYGSICMIDEEQVQLMKRRGGVGHDLSHLRPAGVAVNGCANTSTGSVSFAPRYSHSTREVAQDGRRGALMLSHHINHPDIESFITLKEDVKQVTGANLSVKLTDEFMYGVLNNENHLFQFPVDSLAPEHLYGAKPCKEIFQKLVHQAWKTGEPGALFWDTILKESPADCYKEFGFKTKSTNPCGELPLSPYDSCRLGHINLYAYVDFPFTEKASFNWTRFRSDVQFIQRLMDNIIDLEEEKINDILALVSSSSDDEVIKSREYSLWEKIKKSLVNGRRTGLGVMGEADMVAALNLPYISRATKDFIVTVHRILAVESYISSIQLAKERGAFPVWNLEKEKNNPFLERILVALEEEPGKRGFIICDYEASGRRNIANLTIAPTGTTSQLALRSGVSSGFEPVFEILYKRRRKINPSDTNIKVDFTDEVGDKWEEYQVLHPGFLRWALVQNPKNTEEYLTSLDAESLRELVKTSPYYQSTANEIDVISKIHLQGAVQKWVDHSISVTHNLPSATTEEEIESFFIEAWKSGCKGITVYRDKCRAGVLVREIDKVIESGLFHYLEAQERPEILNCEIHRLQAKGEYWFVLIGLLNSRPYEVFAIKEGRLPSCLRINSSLTLRGQIVKVASKKYDLITVRPDLNEPVIVRDIISLMDNEDDRTDTKRFSLELRHHIDPKHIIETIEKQQKEISSFEKAIARVLKKYVKDGEKSGLVCTSCGSTDVYYSGGCPVCRACGNSKCG